MKRNKSHIFILVWALMHFMEGAAEADVKTFFPKRPFIVLEGKEIRSLAEGSDTTEELRSKIESITQEKADEFCSSKDEFELAKSWKGAFLKSGRSEIPSYILEKIECSSADVKEHTQKALEKIEEVQQQLPRPTLRCGGRQGISHLPKRVHFEDEDNDEVIGRSKRSHEYEEEDFENVHDISAVEKHVNDLIENKGYDEDEILVIFDVDRTLTASRDPSDLKPMPRENAQATVKSLQERGVPMIASSAWQDVYGTLAKLKHLDLSEAFGAKGNQVYLFVDQYRDKETNQLVLMKTLRNGNVISVREEPSDRGEYVQKALAARSLNPKTLAKIKRVIFVDDQEDYIQTFKRDAKRFLPFGSQLEKIDYFNLTDPEFPSAPKIRGLGRPTLRGFATQNAVNQVASHHVASGHVSPGQVKSDQITANPLPLPINKYPWFDPTTTQGNGTAGGLIYTQVRNSSGQRKTYVLLGKERFGDAVGSWSMMRGEVDPGETFSQASAREMTEESAEVFQVDENILKTYPFSVYKKRDGSHHLTYFARAPFKPAQKFRDALRSPSLDDHSKEMTDYMWVDLDDLEAALQSSPVLIPTDYGPSRTVKFTSTSPGGRHQGSTKSITLRPIAYQVLKQAHEDGSLSYLRASSSAVNQINGTGSGHNHPGLGQQVGGRKFRTRMNPGSNADTFNGNDILRNATPADLHNPGSLQMDLSPLPGENPATVIPKLQTSIRIFQTISPQGSAPGTWFSESLGSDWLRIYYVDYTHHVKMLVVNVKQKPYKLPSVILQPNAQWLPLSRVHEQARALGLLH